MSSPKNWGWALIVTGATLEVGLLLVLGLAVSTDAGPGNIGFVAAMMAPFLAMIVGGCYLLRK